MTRRELDLAHQRRQALIARNVNAWLARALAGLPDLGQPALEAYAAAAYPTVAAGQTTAARTAASYLALLVPRRRTRGRPAAFPAVDVAGALRRTDTLIAPDAPVCVAPVLRARAIVADGAELAEAVQGATSYAGGLASGDLQAAQRVGLDEGAHAAGANVNGWQKATGGGACDWCYDISGRTYESAADVPFHEHDRCSVVPVVEGQHSGAAIDEHAGDPDWDIPF